MKRASRQMRFICLALAGLLTLALLIPRTAWAEIRVNYRLVSATGIWDNKRNGRSLKLLVEFTNNSNESVRITKIHDRRLHFVGYARHNNFSGRSVYFNKNVNFPSANTVNIYPGKSAQIYFLVPYEDFLGGEYTSRKNWNWSQAPRFDIQSFNMKFRYEWLR